MSNNEMVSVPRELLERIAHWGSVTWPDKNQLRALLAEPMPPAVGEPVPEYFVAACDKFEWTAKEALRFYAEGKHFDVVDGHTRILCTGAIASHALKGIDGEYADMKGIEPADGEPEVLATVDAHGTMLRSSKPLRSVELVNRAHVTRLQAEVSHLRQHKNDYMEAAEETRRALQSDLDALKAQPQGEPVAAQKYDDTLLPFLALMRKELHANVGKGDRPGWLTMSSDNCLLEIFYHLGKLQKSVKNRDAAGMTEYAADVANMCMMLLDICGVLAFIEQPAPVAVVMPEREVLRDLIAQAIGGDTYDCTRVWSAWGVGTMSEDDFISFIDQEDRLYEIADACLDEVARLNSL